MPSKNINLPLDLIKAMPAAHIIATATAAIMFVFNISITILHSYCKMLFATLVDNTSVVTCAMEKYIPAANAIMIRMREHGDLNRVDLIANEINGDIIIYILGLFCVTITAALYMHDKDGAVREKIHREISMSGYDLHFLMILYAVTSAMFAYWIYNGSIYYNLLLLYRSDIEFNLSVIVLWSGLQVNYALIITFFMDKPIKYSR